MLIQQQDHDIFELRDQINNTFSNLVRHFDSNDVQPGAPPTTNHHRNLKIPHFHQKLQATTPFFDHLNPAKVSNTQRFVSSFHERQGHELVNYY